MRSWTILAGRLASAGPAAAQENAPMTLAQFLTRWDEIQALKAMALLDPGARALAREMSKSMKAWKDQLDADSKAGRPPRACPVKATTAHFDGEEIATQLRAISEARRGIPFREAMFGYLDRRFPCPAPASRTSPAAAGPQETVPARFR
jgi:hypothetical protein